jgi:hypothetical protein
LTLTLSSEFEPVKDLKLQFSGSRHVRISVWSVQAFESRARNQEKPMRRVFVSVLVLFVFAVTAYAADVDGTWTGTVTGAGGEIPVTFKFKAEGTKLTGSTVGFDGTEVAISEGKIDGNTITFSVNFDFGGMPFVLSYKGVVATDQIKVSGDAFGMPFEFVLKKAKQP